MRGCPLSPVEHGFPKMEKKLKKIRADELLLKNKLCESRTQAKALIMAGQVRSGSERIDKPSRLLREDSDLSILRPLKFVGRGGLKMENFLLESNFDVKNLHILDIGASTGGFTDCLLQKGASLATCVDVGHGQLHYRLRTDPRVKNLEKTNIRELMPEDLEDSPFLFIVMDLSFISLRKALPHAWNFLANNGIICCLVKPQFECTKKEADMGKGIIRDEAIRDRILNEMKSFADENLRDSKIIFETKARPEGTDGNQEFFLSWQKVY